MSRYTEAQLVSLIGQVNRLTDSPLEPLTADWGPSVGHHYLRRGTGGYLLAKAGNAAGEYTDVFGAGWMTKPELGIRLEAYVKGLEAARRVAVA